MAECISRLSISSCSPLASQRFSSNNNPSSCSKFSTVKVPMIPGNSRIKAMAENGSGRVQQRQNKIQQSQQPQRLRSAPVGLWYKFPEAKTVRQMMDTMDMLVDDPLAFYGRWPTPSSSSPTAPENARYRSGRKPWEIKESEGEYKMRFDMPGMTREDVKVWVEEKMLVFKAEKLPKNNGDKEDEGEWSPDSYGRYNMRISLPENVELERIRAEVKDGVLYITIPKANERAKAFDIKVE